MAILKGEIKALAISDSKQCQKHANKRDWQETCQCDFVYVQRGQPSGSIEGYVLWRREDETEAAFISRANNYMTLY